ncbi:hypothetical protein [Rhodoluna sp.]|jgi:hypothetical protein|uniref:hypothetical protein n=1 Tax=Rhodoluna sp. TaxID=1969481 RepID=UPI0025F10CB2|nr:hypothetical protein [Rhodoluna sp.]
MPQIELTPTHLVVKLTKGERFMSLQADDLKIPAALVRGAEVAGHDVWQTLGMRIGTGIPTYLAYGRFWRPAGWTFAAWFSKRQAVIITLATAPGQRYKRLVISTDDAQSMADSINDAIVAC